MANTTKMGIPYPAATDYVSDGATDMQAIADQVDLRSGLVKIIPTGGTNCTVAANGDVTISASAVSSVTVTGAFTGNFTNYRVTIDGMDCSASDTAIYIRPGGDTTVSSYSGGGYYVKFDATGVGYTSNMNTTDGINIAITSTTVCSVAFDVFEPNVAQWTRAQGGNTGDVYICHYGGVHKKATAYTSFELRPGAGTLTGGKIRIYGYN